MAITHNGLRTFVLGLDGTPYSLLKDASFRTYIPNLSRLLDQNGKRMNSVYPTVSSVAWTSYMTGLDPSGHNIFGFVDRNPNPFSIKIPTAIDRRAVTLWKELSLKGKRVIVINVPLTYPPEEVNGILVSDFLCTDINKVSYPLEFNNYLKDKDYVIDVDASLAKEDKRRFMDELHRAMEKRFEITFELIAKEEWDFFQLHIMETDRLFHFFWDDLDNKGEYYHDIINFFKKLDDYIGKLENLLSEKDRFLILSDHGFCGIKYEVQLNVWLQQQGLLKFTNGEKKLPNYHKDTICYSLIPGRIFINLEGREEKGSVKKSDYQSIREDIKQRLLDFIHPDSGEKVIDKVFFREEIYSGPYLDSAADIITHPKRGYDLKARTENKDVFERTHLNGMHTYDDAFICAKNCDVSAVVSIRDVKSVILDSSSEDRCQRTEVRHEQE